MKAGSLTRSGRRLRDLWRSWQGGATRPLPPVRIDTGLALPSWVFRVILAGLTMGCASLLASNTIAVVASVAGTVLVAIWPGGPMPSVYAAGIGLLLVASSNPLEYKGFVVLFGVHLLVTLGAIVGRIGWTGLIELRVLVAPARRFAAIQAFAQLVALGAAWVTTRHLALPWIPVLVGVGLAALTWLLLPRLTRSSSYLSE